LYFKLGCIGVILFKFRKKLERLETAESINLGLFLGRICLHHA